MPEIVIVDEIGTEAEALACRTIAERGVQVGLQGQAWACGVKSQPMLHELLALLAHRHGVAWPASVPITSPSACPPPPQLIGTAHGQLLENLIKNPTLSDLVGGICSVTLGERPPHVASSAVVWGLAEAAVMPICSTMPSCMHHHVCLAAHAPTLLTHHPQATRRRGRAARRRACWSARRRPPSRWCARHGLKAWSASLSCTRAGCPCPRACRHAQ